MVCMVCVCMVFMSVYVTLAMELVDGACVCDMCMCERLFVCVLE